MLTILLSFLFVIGGLILAHELGHFLTARAFKVRVEEFGLGYPPRIIGVKLGETTYSLNLFPVGGFTRMAGEEDPGVPASFASKSRPARLTILGAGAFMNAVLPIFLLTIAFMLPRNVISGEVTVDKVASGSPAEVTGITPGDIILEVNGRRVENLTDLRRVVQANLGRAVTVRLKKAGGEGKAVWVTPRWKPPAGEGAVGIVLRLENYTITRTRSSLWRAVAQGLGETYGSYILIRNGLASMLIGATPVQFAGPVAIAQITGEVVQAGLSPLLEFASFLSINLAILNLLPIPALDGGRIMFVIIEWLRRGKRISPRIEGMVHLIGFITLMALIVLVTFTDIIRIIHGGGFIP